MKEKVDEYLSKLDCLNIINSIHKLESQIQYLDTKFRYAAMNNNASNNINRNEEDEESKNMELMDEESKHDALVSNKNFNNTINQLSNQSKQLL